MTDAIKRELREAFRAMTEDELKEAIKEIPSDILAGEYYDRLRFAEEKMTSLEQIVRVRR